MNRVRPLIPKALLVLTLLFLLLATRQEQIVWAQDPEAGTPTFTISSPSKPITNDTRIFGLTLEPIRQVTADSQYFYRSPEGLLALKNLGVTTLLYSTDRNNWRALYDDMDGSPQPYGGAGISPTEAIGIAQAIGAEFVPILNVTIQCEHIANTAYTSANMTCQEAKVGDALDLIKLVKTETQNRGVVFKRVVMGLEPYAGCAYWSAPAGLNCALENPPGQHRTGVPAEEYAKRINSWTPKIKKIDKGIEIGAQLSPNMYYCKTSCSKEWNQVVLQDAGKNIDFVLFHQYFRIPDPGATDTPSAQNYSYYQNQIDINKRKRQVTGMPERMRQDLTKWAPTGKKQMPMWYAEMNASIVDTLDGEDAASVRRALYSGVAVGELYLDMMAPVKVSGTLAAGGTRVFLHHLFTTRTFIAAYQPPSATNQVMIETPGWHILSMLKAFSGQGWQTIQSKNVPVNSPGQPLIRAYATRSGKKVTLAFFNHSAQQTYAIDANLTGMTAKSVAITRIGDQAVSFLSQNNVFTPNAIIPVQSTLPKAQIKSWGLDNVSLPAHSLTLLQVTLKK